MPTAAQQAALRSLYWVQCATAFPAGLLLVLKPELVFPKAMANAAAVPELPTLLSGLGMLKLTTCIIYYKHRNANFLGLPSASCVASVFGLEQLISAYLVASSWAQGKGTEWSWLSVALHGGMAVGTVALLGVKGLLRGLWLSPP